MPKTPGDGDVTDPGSDDLDKQTEGDPVDTADSSSTGQPQQTSAPTEGEGQHRRFEPETHFHNPDLSRTQLPSPKSGDIYEGLLGVFNPDWTDEEMDQAAVWAQSERRAREMREEEMREEASDEVELSDTGSAGGVYGVTVPMPDGTLITVDKSGEFERIPDDAMPPFEDGGARTTTDEPDDLEIDDLPGMERDEPPPDDPVPDEPIVPDRGRASEVANDNPAKRRELTSTASRKHLAQLALGGLVLIAAGYFIFVDRGPTVTEPILGQESATETDAPETPASGQSPSEDQPPTEQENVISGGLEGKGYDIPSDYDADTVGNRPSGLENTEVAEPDATTPEAKASNIIAVKFGYGSYVFSLIVEGDGESLSMAENTSYQFSFIVNNEWPNNEFYDDTGFRVLGTTVWDQQNNLTRGAVVVEWLDSQTLQVTVDVEKTDLDPDTVVTEVRTELAVTITDDTGKSLFFFHDIAIWKAP